MAGMKTVSIGDILPTNNYGNVQVLKKLEKQRFLVKFISDGTVVDVASGNIVKGKLSNYNHPSIYGIGFMGYGKYRGSEYSWIRDRWTHMLERCYSDKKQIECPSYRGVTVCEEWHNFQNFAKDFISFKNHDKTGWQIDKDILIKGNKIYSKSTCCMLPQELNNLTLRRKSLRGDLPLGVTLVRGKIKAQIGFLGKHKSLGLFENALEAFQAYKSAKEAIIQSQAEKWKDELDTKAYNALLNYTIEIED